MRRTEARWNSKQLLPAEEPLYTSAMAGRLVGLRPERVRRWLQGYEYRYTIPGRQEVRMGHQEPVVSKRGTANDSYASFLDLIDLLFVKEFLEYGLSLQRLRKALQETEAILPGHHFAQRSFFTDGHNIYLQLSGNADALLQLLSGGQWVIAPVIKTLAKQIDFQEPTGFAERWYPLGRSGKVVLDPRVAFGAPSVVGKGVKTANIFDLFEAEERRVDPVCSWLGLEPDEVKAAVKFEEKLKAA